MAQQPLPPDMLGGNPPAAPKGPTFAGMAGPQAGGAPPTGMSPGVSQVSSAAVRMAMEIDQAIKVLAQQVPTMLPWAEKTTVELRMLLNQALTSGAIPTSATPGGNTAAFPDGSGRL